MLRTRAENLSQVCEVIHSYYLILTLLIQKASNKDLSTCQKQITICHKTHHDIVDHSSNLASQFGTIDCQLVE